MVVNENNEINFEFKKLKDLEFQNFPTKRPKHSNTDEVHDWSLEKLEEEMNLVLNRKSNRPSAVRKEIEKVYNYHLSKGQLPSIKNTIEDLDEKILMSLQKIIVEICKQQGVHSPNKDYLRKFAVCKVSNPKGSAAFLTYEVFFCAEHIGNIFGRQVADENGFTIDFAFAPINKPNSILKDLV